jgi:transketolase
MAATKFILGMRDRFFDALYEIAKKDKNLIFITADNGAPSLDKYAQTLPNQYFTVGIAEQQMIGMAAGLATEGKKVYTYAIAPFVTARVFEQNKLDLCAMNLPVVNVGVGAGYAYDIMGPSHHTVEDVSIMRALPNMTIHSPADGVTAEALAEISYRDPSPQYIRFDRSGIPDLYEGKNANFGDGLQVLRRGGDLCLAATGIMVHQALKVADVLGGKGIRCGVVDVHRLKPLNKPLFLRVLADSARLATLEEHLLTGGLGSMAAELLADEGIQKPLLRIGQDERFVFMNGGRQAIWEKYGLNVDGVVSRIEGWIKKS